jgi:hypothetical protein
MDPIVLIPNYLILDDSGLPTFLIEKLDKSDYRLYNSKLQNGTVTEYLKQKVNYWYRINDSYYSDCFIESGECVLHVNDSFWWGTIEIVDGLWLDSLTLQNIFNKVKELKKDRQIKTATVE